MSLWLCTEVSVYIAIASIVISVLQILWWPLFWFFRVRRW